MIKIFLLFFLLTISIDVNAKILNIKVIDEDIGIPLEKVKVTMKEKEFYTDIDGNVMMEIPDNETRVLITLMLNGYEIKKAVINYFNKIIIIKMKIKYSIKEKELLIEERRYKDKDDEIGVSTKIDKNDLKSTSQRGLVEDVFSSIKFMPGVSSSRNGMERSGLSIRGGAPNDFTALLDGFLIRDPYYWNGQYSIFNPNIVDSVIFSNGIFNARDGLTTSGMMDIKTVKPDEGFKFDSNTGITTIESFFHVPIGKFSSGFYIGGRYINLYIPYDLFSKIIPRGNNQPGFSITPYIRDAQFKWFLKANDRLEWYINGFFGNDGVGRDAKMIQKVDDGEIENTFDVEYYKYHALGVTGLKILPVDTVFINFMIGYEFLKNGRNAFFTESVEKEYSSDFIEYAESNPKIRLTSDEFEIDDIESNFYEANTIHSIQSRYDMDITLHKSILFYTGIGIIGDFILNESGGEIYRIIKENGNPTYLKVEYENDLENKKFIFSFLYMGFEFIPLANKLVIDTGCRVDYFSLIGEGYTINTYPIPSPRFKITYTPVRDLNFLHHISLTAGAGLFTKIPDNTNQITADMNLGNFDLTFTKAVSTVIGFDIEFPFGLRFKVEGYYKYCFDRLYINTDDDSGEREYLIHNNGIAHVAGFDFVFEKKFSRYIDGWISYSFNYARYYNPETDDIEEETTMDGDPTGIWYYPSYHIFHSLKILVNIKPLNWLTITPSFSFESGTPKKEYEDPDMFAARLDDGTWAEMYYQEESYSDTLRNDFSIPFNLKISFNFMLPKTKLEFELYCAVEDLFVLLYNPAQETVINKYTGEEQGSSKPRYNMNYPTPSIGIKLSY